MNAVNMRRVGPVLLLSAFLAAGCRAPVGEADVEATATATQAAAGIIAGRVWLDECLDGVGCRQDGGAARPDGVESPEEAGLEGVLVQLGDGACPSLGLSETLTGPNGTYVFASLAPGTYCVSIDPAMAANGLILGSAPWTHPAYGDGMSHISVTLNKEDETRLVSFGRAAPAQATATPTSTPETAIAPSPTPGDAAQGCLLRVAFVKDVTVPDMTRLEAGKAFDKVWRLRNAGTCTWTPAYDLVFVSGQRMGAPESQVLARSVAPGETVDVSVRLRAPVDDGLYFGRWMLRNDEDVLFGLGASGNAPFWAQILVGPLGVADCGSWRGEYFARRDLSGTVGFVRNDPVIDFNWGTASPGAPLASDHFSVRWTGDATFEAGTYRFKVTVDDGARLYVDNVLVINAWEDGGERERTADVALARGSHRIRLEYYDRTRQAAIGLRWTKVSKPSFDDWKGQYWSNREFKGDPVLVRNDRSLNFNWDDGAPAVGISADNFSARWTQEISFNEGVYRLSLRSDDGARVYIDGDKVLDNWRDNDGSQTRTADVYLSGTKSVRVEYYERSGEARIEFGWVRLETTATPSSTTHPATATASATPTATELPPATETATASATPIPSETLSSPETANATEAPATATPTPTEAQSGPGPQFTFGGATASQIKVLPPKLSALRPET